jgi:hypothetical protein
VATTPQPAAAVSDLHFHADPVQIGDQIMVQVQVADNFGLTFQMVMHPKIANAFGMMLRDTAHNAETTLVKPPNLIHEV